MVDASESARRDDALTGRYRVDSARCIRCGACSSLVPEVFVVDFAPCRIAKTATLGEIPPCEAALLVCPTRAIHRDAAPEGAKASEARVRGEIRTASGLYADLSGQAELVRWSLHDIPWRELDPAAVTPALRALVREMAFSEHATFSATQRFLQAFHADVDFTQWIAVWFYEETRHPHVLTEWLRRLGEPLDDDFARRGRVSTPFMKSRIGTLVTNVISEVTAAHAYRCLSTSIAEPVLAAIAARIAADESRHAASFFRFARAELEQSERPERDRLDALKILHLWLADAEAVTHPVNQLSQRLAGSEGGGVLAASGFDLPALQRRMTRLVALLLGLPLRAPADVMPLLRELVAAKARGQAGSAVDD